MYSVQQDGIQDMTAAECYRSTVFGNTGRVVMLLGGVWNVYNPEVIVPPIDEL